MGNSLVESLINEYDRGELLTEFYCSNHIAEYYNCRGSMTAMEAARLFIVDKLKAREGSLSDLPLLLEVIEGLADTLIGY